MARSSSRVSEENERKVLFFLQGGGKGHPGQKRGRCGIRPRRREAAFLLRDRGKLGGKGLQLLRKGRGKSLFSGGGEGLHIRKDNELYYCNRSREEGGGNR